MTMREPRGEYARLSLGLEPLRDATVAPICPYCGETARLTDSAEVYGGKSYGMIWLCANYPACDAYVGCHKGGDEPLGRMADAALRKAKIAAHAAFDPLWKDGGMRRSDAYRLLAEVMELSGDACHIGMMDLETCQRVPEALKMIGSRAT